MNTTQRYRVDTGLVNISTANSNLDGTGSLGTIMQSLPLSGTVTNGTLVRSITIKATQATTQGMIRFFIANGLTNYLVKEVMIPAVTPSGILPAYSMTIPFPLRLTNNQVLYASTQNAESFNIFADCMSFGSCDCSANCDCGEVATLAPIDKMVGISTANPNLDGSGTLGLILTAGGSTNCGTGIRSITVKSTQDVTQGMVRLFISDGVTKFLFCEIPIRPSTTNSGVLPSFGLMLPAAFNLAKGYSLYASTENAESFNVVVNGTEFECCDC